MKIQVSHIADRANPVINVRKLLSVIALMVMALTMLSACSSPDIDEVKEQYYQVDFSGVVPADSMSGGITFGDAIDGYCPGGSWDNGTSVSGDKLVEYSGGDSPDGEVNIQWVKGESGWSVWAMEIDG
ncbi:MAG: hypothetical protein LBG50_04380, partial [Clostridiales Family XIII bacterium]|nr:hypothetical protein [Clostridiales Family XIII bacterium]